MREYAVSAQVRCECVKSMSVNKQVCECECECVSV